jgi:hypothetical protein
MIMTYNQEERGYFGSIIFYEKEKPSLTIEVFHEKVLE